MKWLKIGLVSVLALSTSTAGAVGQTLTPPAPVGPTTALDGEATPDACAQFGYSVRTRDHRGGPPPAYMPGATPPPPPPPPPAAAAAAADAAGPG